MSEPTMRERVSRERREAVAKAMAFIESPHWADAGWMAWTDEMRQDMLDMADAAILALLPDRTAFETAVDELVDVIKGFEPDSTIEDKKIALRDLVYGADDASGGTR